MSKSYKSALFSALFFFKWVAFAFYMDSIESSRFWLSNLCSIMRGLISRIKT
ncbi:hypothetical protein VCRA2116O29_620019 [Vibrio crassostreae]|nr:hypothetical protein VCRA2113O418_70062 [Vibrio crassostreae]CAK2519683.1 hypothetical protein VCRA2116O29_620019 [Vibrio crassostreae]CAK2530530.1 hypothetical protein VCRA2119O48_610004 [Vibrio crassostreae]CAK3868734.1 hypothetical protein VCRA2123O74_590004 [Vibrio crassostreae]CAK4007357.1 hypothetical protein VCRA212O16_670004 [Vibrio crassostreae]